MNYNKNHVITRKDNEQVMNGLKQSDVVIPNTGITLTLFKGRGRMLRRF